MATILGTHITNMDATPFNRVLAVEYGGFQKTISLTEEFPVMSLADVEIVAKLPIDAVLPSIKLASDDLGTTGTLNIGFYKKNTDGTYTAVSAAAIASAINVNTAAVALTEYRFSVKDINTAKQKVWELAGLSARPAYSDMYVGVAAAAATTAIGTVSMFIDFVE